MAAGRANAEDLAPEHTMAKAFDDIADIVEDATGQSMGAGMVLNIMEEGEAAVFEAADEMRQLQMVQFQMLRRQFQHLNWAGTLFSASIMFPTLRTILLRSEL